MVFTLIDGITMTVEYDATGYYAKGLSGRKVSVCPLYDVLDAQSISEQNIIVKNAWLYGIASGSSSLRGVVNYSACVTLVHYR